MKAKIALYCIGAAFFFVIAVVSLALLSWNIFLQGIGTIGGSTAFAVFLVLLVSTIPQLQKVASYFARAFSFWRVAELASVKFSVEGNLNSFREKIDDETKGAIPYPVRIEWVTTEDPTTFLDKFKGEIIIRMKHHSYEPRNLAYATMNYTSKGALPLARMYLDEKISKSVDLSLTKKMLVQQGHKKALDFFLMEIVPHHVADEDIRRYLTIMEKLDQAGLFTRVLLHELLELARRLYPNVDEHAIGDTTKFVEYLNKIVERKRGEKTELTYIGKRIHTGFVMVAQREKFYASGFEPWVFWSKERAKRCDSIYILARADLVGPARLIALQLEKLGGFHMLTGSNEPYIAKLNGKAVPSVCITFTVKHSI